ncbi:MAG TPA: hypothetical protein VJS68_03695 [Thermoplasmata archaeon]|nr:hypothetical protein [Thermoplasmata archaeon]
MPTRKRRKRSPSAPNPPRRSDPGARSETKSAAGIRPAVLPPPSPSELFEEVGATFEEVTNHVGHRPEFTGLSWGPVLPLPIDAVASATLGWSRIVTHRSGGTAAILGTIYLLLLPRQPSGRSPMPAEPPLRGRCWEDFSVVELLESDPSPRLLLARPSYPASAPRLDSVCRAIREEFREEEA